MTRRARKPAKAAARASALATYAPFVAAALTFLAFLPALQGQFISWDDRANFLANQHYRGLGLRELQWMWTTNHLGHYVPLSWMSLGLDYLLWGMSPAGYHLTSMLLHAANAALVFLIARRIFSVASAGSRRSDDIIIASLASSLFFSLHPLRVESVAWITERRDVQSLFFLLISVLFHLESSMKERAGRAYGIALAAFVCALLSKATTVTLPVVLLILNVYPLGRLGGATGYFGANARRIYLELVPFFLLSAAAGIGSILALTPGRQLAISEKVAVSMYSLAFYLKQTLAPFNLSPLYEMPWRVDVLAMRFVVSYAVIVALTVIAWHARSRWPGAV
ncbi:MAG: hypothetical protein JWM95_2466, partial [Gemmatimonadetes bacterium]|nr:hypothetical protein [Gemmatimonadota bacterium]